MEWINVNDKHFVDIEHFEDGTYEWKANKNFPNKPFLVGIFSYNKITEEFTDFNYWLVFLGDYGLQEFTEDGTVNFPCFSILDIEYWCEVTPPKKIANN